jgi:hypothetical protein
MQKGLVAWGIGSNFLAVKLQFLALALLNRRIGAGAAERGPFI